MKKLVICLLGLPLALSGCVTAEEMAAKQAEFKTQVATIIRGGARHVGLCPVPNDQGPATPSSDGCGAG